MINKNNIIFLGPPGSGKGTLSALMEEKWAYEWVSTGNIFREEVANQSPLGLQVKAIIESGEYVPDSITNEIVNNKVEKLSQAGKKFILDGYPRTVQQAQFLNENFGQQFIVLNLEIADEVIIDRLSQRWFCSECKSTYNMTNLKSAKHPYCQKDDNLLIQRKDDQPEAIKKRLEVYHEQTESLITYYQNQGMLFSINSDAKVDIILGKIEEILKND